MTDSEVAKDYGAILLGGLLAFGCVISLDRKICDLSDRSPYSLSGCVNMQFIVYWRSCSGDHWRTKSLVRKSVFEFTFFNRLTQVTAIWYVRVSACEMDVDGIQAA